MKQLFFCAALLFSSISVAQPTQEQLDHNLRVDIYRELVKDCQTLIQNEWYKEALPFAKKLYSLDSINPMNMYRLGFTLFCTGELKEALPLLIKASDYADFRADKFTSDRSYCPIEVFEVISLIYEKLGEYDKAIFWKSKSK